jgi:biopolymer transport protein ExbD
MRKRTRRTDEAFQMAPMIDMVFLLLVFFMTVSTLAKEARPETGLPISDTAQVPSEAPPRDIVTVLPKDDLYQVFWYNREVGKEDLAKLLKQSREVSGSELLLRGPPELPWKYWKEILEIVRAAGIVELVFATYEG